MNESTGNPVLGKIAAITAIIYYVYALIEKLVYKIPLLNFRIVTMLFAVLALILLIIAFFKIKNSLTYTGKYIFLRKKYFIGLILFTVSVFALLGLQYSKSISDVTSNKEKIRIVVLLPIDKNKCEQPAYQDGKRQAFGYIDFIEKKQEILKDYDVIIKNHGMNPEQAINIVKDELEQGTDYFICTMSHVSEALSAQFESLVENHKPYSKEKPKLIITVSSSNQIQLKKNLIYRFYIRSNEESKLYSDFFTKYKNSTKSNKLISITGADNYGDRAKEVFQKEYGNLFTYSVRLKLDWNKERIKEELSSELGMLKNDSNCTYFIVHYGNGLDNIISSLYELKLNGLLMISHPITVQEWYNPIKTIIPDYKWISCYPESRDGTCYESDDIIRDFVYFTLDRLVAIIEKSKTTAIDFDTEWKSMENEPNRIIFKINDDGDSEIKLKIKSHNL